jgi:hypothetical protein
MGDIARYLVISVASFARTLGRFVVAALAHRPAGRHCAEVVVAPSPDP